MSTLNTIDTLFRLSLNQLCKTMNEDTLQYVLKSSAPSICMEIMCKVLGLKLSDTCRNTVKSGYDIAQMDFQPLACYMSLDIIKPEIIERFAASQQIPFVDRLNCSSFFDHRLFFKLVGQTNLRSYVFILFQIFIEIKGFKFPSNFAQEWVNMEKPDSNEGMCLPDIENGLKLGSFLGDAGWLVESALVLSHTYEIITTKWVCHDEIVQLFKTLQCLSKWLLVASNYYNFVEAKKVLQDLVKAIDIIEQLEERTLSISYAYLAVSQYYYVLLEFDKAWSWAVKAILELHMASRDWKILILCHSIKVCCALYKFNMAQKLRKQLNTLKNISDHYMVLNLLLSKASYLSKVDTLQFSSSIDSHYNALGTARSLFGYFNLNTAIILTNYARHRHTYQADLEVGESIRCILQAIFIMQKIGVPNDNMLLVNAHLIKSLLIQVMTYVAEQTPGMNLDLNTGGLAGIERINQNAIIKQFFSEIVEIACSNALQVALHSLGENNLLTAKIYYYLGTIYIYDDKHTESKEMYLKEIEIIKSILGTNNVKFANSTGHLSNLYVHHLCKFPEAELLLLQIIKIYESISDGPINEFRTALRNLTYTYKGLDNVERFNYYTKYLANVNSTHENWFNALLCEISEENCTNINLSLEKFKCILNGCSCGQ